VFASIEFHVYLQLEDFLSRGKIENSATIDHQSLLIDDGSNKCKLIPPKNSPRK